MPPLAAAGAAIATAATSAVAGLTIAGIAQGAMIAGTAMSAIGMITGNKTITKIGMGLGLAGGVGAVSNGMRGLAATRGAAGITGNSSKSAGLLAVDNIDASLAAKTPGLKTFKAPSGTDLPSMQNFTDNAAKVGGVTPTNQPVFQFNPELEKSYFQRANDTLTKYNTLFNVAGGMGDAYMVNESNQLRKDLLDKEIKFQQGNIDWQHANNSVPISNPGLTVVRNPDAYTGLLRR